MDITYCKKKGIVSVKMNFIDRCGLKNAIGREDFNYLWNLIDNINDATVNPEEEILISEVEPSGEEIRAWFEHTLTETN